VTTSLPRPGRLLPLPPLPARSRRSPEVFKTFEHIRFALWTNDGLEEFCWFAREYPRYYRYQLDHAWFRLTWMHRRYQEAHVWFSKNFPVNLDCFEQSVQTEASIANYWDFEAMLSSLSTALDLLARIVGTAYEDQLPPSFSKLCRRTDLEGVAAMLRDAKVGWVDRMKDYRDCFVHYTPVDTILSLSATRYPDGIELRAKLPVNPNARESLDFRYKRRPELLRSAIHIWRRMTALDSRVAKELRRLYLAKEFPKRTRHLHGVGRRHRDIEPNAENPGAASRLGPGIGPGTARRPRR